MYTANLAALDKTDFHLSKAVNLSTTRQIAYRSLSEYLTHQQTLQPDDNDRIFNMHIRWPLTILSFVLSALALLLILLLSFKIRALTLLLSVKHAAAVPTHFNFFSATTTLPSTLPTTAVTLFCTREVRKM